MSDLTKEDLEIALQKAIEYTPRTSIIDDATHESHHKYVAVMIERSRRRRNRIEKFQLSLIGTAATLVVAGFVWLGTLIVEGFKHVIGVAQ